MIQTIRWVGQMTDARKIFTAILLFIALDLSVLTINFRIAYLVDHDVVAINLAGRQRMLSQRITKVLLSLQLESSKESRARAELELRDAAKLFDQTLKAFSHGGNATGGDGKPVILNPVNQGQASTLVNQAQVIWKPAQKLLFPYFNSQEMIPDAVLSQSQTEMLQINLKLLDLMNQLTTVLEQDSRNRANTLRIVQTSVFLLALFNFVVIVRRFHLLAWEAHKAKEQYSELALRDPLTGIFNRRYFENSLKRHIGGADRRQHDQFALLMIDLDGFKSINDRLGHDAGDIVLKTVAARLTQHARVNDVVARLGGDEFVLICPELHDEKSAVKFCDRLLNSITEPMLVPQELIQIGASIGVAFYPVPDRPDADLVQMADHAMYLAKRSGRNRFAVFKDFNED